MLAISIIGVMAALMAPGLSEFLADARASSASEDLVRLARHTRARVQETGLAHLMLFEGAATGGLGRVRVWEGMNDHCRTTPWANTVNGTVAQGHAPVEDLDMLRYNQSAGASESPTKDDADRQVIRLTAAQGGSAVASFGLCFQPNGQTLQSNHNVPTDFTAAVATTFVVQRVPLLFTFNRTVNGTEHGVPREILFPPGGAARMRL